MTLTVVTAPWTAGANEGYWLAAAAAGLSVTVLVSAVSALRAWEGSRAAATFWCGAAFAAVGACQTLSPIRGDRLENPAGGLSSSLIPVTASAADTRAALAAVIAGLATFLLAGRAGRTAAGRRVLLWAVAATGAAVAAAGVAWRLGSGEPLGLGRGDGGTFFLGVNRTHAAFVMNLGLAATAGLLATGGHAGRRTAWVLGAVSAAGVVAAGSRAGVAAGLAGFCAAAGVLSLIRPRGGGGAGVTPAGPAARAAGAVLAGGAGLCVAGFLAALAWLGADRTTLARLPASVGGGADGGFAGEWDARLRHWSEALHLLGDLPLFGAGLGTYGYATAPYFATTSGKWRRNADGHYVEVLVETGVVGLALALLGAGFVAAAVRRAARGGRADAAAAGAFALTVVLLQALSDFALARPFVIVAAAATLGTACGGGSGGGKRAGAAARFAGPAVGAALAAACGWAAWERAVAAPAGPIRLTRSLAGDGRSWTAREADATREALAGVVAARPDDGEARLALAVLLFREYRAAVAGRLRADPATAGLTGRRVRDLSDPAVPPLLAIAAGDPAAVAAWREDPLVVAHLRPAWRHLLAARRACPWLPALDLHLARVAWVDPAEDPAGERFLASAHRNFPAGGGTQRGVARRARAVGLTALSDAAWRAAVALDPADAVELAEDLSEPAAAEPAYAGAALAARVADALPSDPTARVAAARALAGPRPALAAAVAAGVLEGVLGGDGLPPLTRAWALRLAGRGGAADAMAEHLAASPRDAAARAALAGWLIAAGDRDGAADQLAALAALAPRHPALRDLEAKLRAPRTAR